MNEQATRYGMSPEEKDELYSKLTEKFGYDKVKFDQPMEEATESAGNKRLMGSIIDGIAQIGTANAVARGGKGYDGSAGKILNQAADTSVSEAANKRKAMIEDYLTKKNLYESVEGQSNRLADQQITKDQHDDETAYRRSQDAINNQFRENEFKAKTAHNAAVLAQNSANKQADLDAKATEGQKTFDKEFAKDYNEWTSGGRETAQSEITKLKAVRDKLEGGGIDLGKTNALIPDIFADSDRIGARADVESSVMSSLRQIMGAAFTENEGKRVINATWNENDTAENNLARLNRLIGKLESDAKAKDAKASYFEANKGSMSGYKAGGSMSVPEPETKTINGKTYRKVQGGWEEVD